MRESPHGLHIPSHLTIILNAAAGGMGTEGICRRLSDLFRAYGLEAQIWPAASSADLVHLSRRAALQTHHLIVAAGGDGTVNAVASALVGTDNILGILPLGTLNHFAKDLQIPLDLEAAVRTIIEGRVIRVDVGKVNGYVFLNNASLGMYPEIVKERQAHQQRGLSKWLALCLATLAVLCRYPRERVHVRVGDQELIRISTIVFVGNNEYLWEGFDLGTRQRLDQGFLCVYVLHQARPWDLLRFLWRLLRGRRHEASEFDQIYTREVIVETRRPRQRLRVALDGEVMELSTPLQYRLCPAALRILVPQSSAKFNS